MPGVVYTCWVESCGSSWMDHVLPHILLYCLSSNLLQLKIHTFWNRVAHGCRLLSQNHLHILSHLLFWTRLPQFLTYSSLVFSSLLSWSTTCVFQISDEFSVLCVSCKIPQPWLNSLSSFNLESSRFWFSRIVYYLNSCQWFESCDPCFVSSFPANTDSFIFLFLQYFRIDLQIGCSWISFNLIIVEKNSNLSWLFSTAKIMISTPKCICSATKFHSWMVFQISSWI